MYRVGSELMDMLDERAKDRIIANMTEAFRSQGQNLEVIQLLWHVIRAPDENRVDDLARRGERRPKAGAGVTLFLQRHLHDLLERLSARLSPTLPPLPEVDPEWQDFARRYPEAHKMAVELFRYRRQHWPDREPTEDESRTDRTFRLLQLRIHASEAGGVDVLFARMFEQRRAREAAAEPTIGGSLP